MRQVLILILGRNKTSCFSSRTLEPWFALCATQRLHCALPVRSVCIVSDRGYHAGNASLISLFARFLGAALRSVCSVRYAAFALCATQRSHCMRSGLSCRKCFPHKPFCKVSGCCVTQRLHCAVRSVCTVRHAVFALYAIGATMQEMLSS